MKYFKLLIILFFIQTFFFIKYIAATPRDTFVKYNECLDLAEKINNKKLTASTLNDIGNLLLVKGKFKKALKYCQKAFALAQEIHSKRIQIIALTSMGNIYTAQNKPKLAEKFYYRASMIKQGYDVIDVNYK